MHKKTLALLIGLFLIAPFLLSQEISKPIAYISDVEGEVLFQGFEQAEINIPVIQGDELNTEKGRAEVYLGNGNFLRLDHYTRVVFAILEEESVLLHVWKGNIYLRINTGTIEIQTNHERSSLSTGLHLIEAGNKTKIYSGLIMIENDFDRFNDRRERTINLSSQKRYLPEELTDYEYTLHNHGSWHYDALYGYVWIPYVRSGWRPYFHGRWVYYPDWGWTWISYELFGWTTFHYGRWHWHSAWNCWYWIPTRIWGPAWVYWHWGYDYVGWYPRWDHRHNDRHYISRHDRGLTVIRKDQLQSRNISKSVMSKEQLKKKLPQNIDIKQLKKNPEIAVEKQVSSRISKTKQVQSIKSRGTIKKEPVSSRTTSEKKVSKTTDSRTRSSSKKATVSKKSSSSSKKATSSKKSSSSKSKSSGKVKKKK